MNLPDPVQYAIPAFIVLIVIEMIVWVRGGRAHYETRDMAASLMMGLGNLGSKILTAGFVASLYGLVYQVRLFEIGYAWWAFIVCFFLEDFAYYWFHRISHERRWFWASHVIHHSSQHYNLSTALRQTWTGSITMSFIFWLPMVWIGFPPAMVAFFSGLSLVYQFWIHTETIGRMGPFEWIFNTPSHHRVHHATNPRYLDANYAGVLIIWDRMFGTFVPEQDDDPCRYGIVKNIATFNPLKIAFHEWWGMARDVASSRSLREVAGYVMGPPGWSPDGSRKTSRSIKEEWRTRLAAGKSPDGDATPS